MTEFTSEKTDREPAETCDCCGDGAERTERRLSADRRLTDTPVEAELPADVQTGLGRMLGEEPVETIAEWVARLRHHTGGDAIDVEDLCHADEVTEHRGTLRDGEEEETYHFQCFYDAVALSVLLDSPVDVRTVSPDGTEIRARALGTESLTVTPPEAVFSVGIDRNVAPPSEEGPTPADVYGAVCPYVRAFRDWEAYEQWAGTARAATVAMPLSGATELAEALLE